MVTISQIIYAITGPLWLQGQISLISILLSGAFLVYFGSFVHGKMILPFGDWIRHNSHKKIHELGSRDTSTLAAITSITLATAFFLLYVYFGGHVLSEYIFTPILLRLRKYILIISIILFGIISYVINNKRLRRKFMGS